MLPFINLFGRTVGSYAVCAVIGLVLSGFVACSLIKRHAISVDDCILILLTVAAGLAGGGCILYGITNWQTILAVLRTIGQASVRDTLAALVTCFGGMVFYGGFLGALVTLHLYTRQYTLAQRRGIFDIYAVVTPLFHAFGRLGCFLGGCCYGIESKFGFLVTDNPLSPDINGVVRFPVQLVEAVYNFALFLLLLHLYRRERATGQLVFRYMLLYPAARFVLEFFRGDELRGIWGGLSTSQWISIALFTVAMCKTLCRHKCGKGLLLEEKLSPSGD